MRLAARCYGDFWYTYINRDMTDNRGMIWESYILGIMTTTIRARPVGCRGLLVNNKCTLDIDLHRTRMNDRAIDFGCVGEGSRSLGR